MVMKLLWTRLTFSTKISLCDLVSRRSKLWKGKMLRLHWKRAALFEFKWKRRETLVPKWTILLNISVSCVVNFLPPSRSFISTLILFSGFTWKRSWHRNLNVELMANSRFIVYWYSHDIVSWMTILKGNCRNWIARQYTRPSLKDMATGSKQFSNVISIAK